VKTGEIYGKGRKIPRTAVGVVNDMCCEQLSTVTGVEIDEYSD
jgi:hypothetical protein